jgi:FkbM family methyltransferase
VSRGAIWHRGVVLARRLRWAAWRRLRRELTFDTAQGRFTVSTADAVLGRWLFCAREFESDLLARVARLMRELRPESGGRVPFALDIGANFGVTTVPLLLGGLAERAVAVEPDPLNFALLERNLLQNGLGGRVIRHRLALSDREGTLDLERSRENFGDHRVRAARGDGELDGGAGAVVEVAGRRLDALAREWPPEARAGLGLVWIDVQGHEAHVFRGGRELLSAGMPVVAEVWPWGLARAGTTPAAYLEVASSLWWRCWRRQGPGWVEGPVAALGPLLERRQEEQLHENVVFTQ